MSPHHPLIIVDSDTLKEYYPRIETFQQEGREISHEAGENIAWKWSRATRMTAKAGDKKMVAGANYTVKGVEVSYFARIFSPEVLKRLVKAPQVQEIMKPNEIPGFRAHVYMITGIMVAEDIEIREGKVTDSQRFETTRSISGHAKVREEITSDRQVETVGVARHDQDVIFAYELVKLEIRGLKGERIERN